MNPQSQSFTISAIDDELIYDTNHILMNYLKMNNFSPNCFSETNIQISKSILDSSISAEIKKNYNQFSTKYFTQLSSSENVIDLLSPLISNYPNSDFGLFLSVILNNHVIDVAQSLIDSNEKFEKYKNYLLNIYHSILQINKKQKLLESICSSISVLILIGINGSWANGLELLISAGKENNGGNFGNMLMASLIISNINYVFDKLKERLSLQNSDFIFTYIKQYSNIIQDFTNFLITVAFKGPKENFVNTPLFKAFIGIIQSFKYFDLNIIKTHGFIDFLINCISYIDINHDLIVQFCDIFNYTFSDKNNIGLIFDYQAGFKISFLTEFLKNIDNHRDFSEIKKCIELINNVKNYYSSKNINEIKTNEKDIQILFASCNIFSSIIENFPYLFFIPDIDTIVQGIYCYFIDLPIYSISQILLNSLYNVTLFAHYGYNFDNYPTNDNIQDVKRQNFNRFLYTIHNSVFQNMKLTSIEEYNDLDFNSFSFNNNNKKLDSNITDLLKQSISDDEKATYIINATDFYEILYEIINDLYGIKDFCDKLFQYLMSSLDNKDLLTVDCILVVFNKIAFKLKNNLPEVTFNMIDFILSSNNNKNINLLSDKRFALQFALLILSMKIQICQNKKYVNILIQNLLSQKYDNEKLNLIMINIICQLITISYQLCKRNNKCDKISDEDKNSLMNIFNILSQYLLDNITHLNNIYLLKVIDSLFISCFFNIHLSIFSNDVVYNIAEKLFKDANQIFEASSIQPNNKKDLYIKYIHIIFSICKNINAENNPLLIELFNIVDPNPNMPTNNNETVTYFINIESNIFKIITDCSEQQQYSDTNIIDSVITLCIKIIESLKEKTAICFIKFSRIISLIHKMNPKNIKELALTITLYKNIIMYCKNGSEYNEISGMCFEILNVMNQKYNIIKSEEDNTYLSSKICEFILLYLSNFPNSIAKICENNSNKNSIFAYAFNEIINTYENSDKEEYCMIFTLLIKSLCENVLIFNEFIKGYIERLTHAIVDHLQKFKSENNKCNPNYFIILKYFSSNFKDKFDSSIERIFNNDKTTTLIIGKYFDSINYKNYNNLENRIKDCNKAFIKEMGELLYAMDKKKKDFFTKYDKISKEMQLVNGNHFDKSCERSNFKISIHK